MVATPEERELGLARIAEIREALAKVPRPPNPFAKNDDEDEPARELASTS